MMILEGWLILWDQGIKRSFSGKLGLKKSIGH